jgi:hypothetical protein
MSRVLRIGSSDYKVVVNDGGTITLDVGDSPGKVVISGNLEVLGETTTINTTETNVEDKILTLNFGDNSNSGISNAGVGTISGIEINRGPNPAFPAARLVFNESITWYDSQTGTDKTGAFSLVTADINRLSIGLQTNGILTKNNNDLVFSLGTGTLSVRGSFGNYEDRVTDPDDVPNVQWVDDFVVDYFETNPPEFIKVGDSVLQIFDSSVDTESLLRLSLDNQTSAEWRTDRFETQGIRIADTEISTFVSNQDLILSSPGSGLIVINDTLKLTTAIDPVLSADDGIKIYSKTQAYGGSGIFFVNKENTRDELVSKRKAIAYSMIF